MQRWVVWSSARGLEYWLLVAFRADLRTDRAPLENEYSPSPLNWVIPPTRPLVESTLSALRHQQLVN
jgi:hypothetical protein